MKLKNPSSEIIFPNVESLIPLVQKWKDKNKSIVFTNGCFDILHAGHIDYLEKTASVADRMIIGLNTDESVNKLKGSNRPINNEDMRASLLASLRVVDAVVLFSEETPIQLITNITPDVLIKGGDYNIEDIAGASHVIRNGGQVATIDFVHSISTSDIIEKIKGL